VGQAPPCFLACTCVWPRFPAARRRGTAGTGAKARRGAEVHRCDQDPGSLPEQTDGLAASRNKRVISSIELDSPMHSTPVAANGVLYVATMKKLYAVKKSAE